MNDQPDEVRVSVEDIDWLDGEFESLSYLAEGEFACTGEDSASYRSDRERANAIFDRLRTAAERATSPAGDAGEAERVDDIRRSIIRQLGDDPHADRIILQPTEWDIVLAALVMRALTEAQRSALVDAATLLDHFAGEGAGMMPRERMGGTLFADDVVMRLCDAFGVGWGDDFGLAVRAHLASASHSEQPRG